MKFLNEFIVNSLLVQLSVNIYYKIKIQFQFYYRIKLKD